MLALKEDIDFKATAYMTVNDSTQIVYWNSRFSFNLPGGKTYHEPWADNSTDILCPMYATRTPGYSQEHKGEDMIIYGSSETSQVWVQDDSCQGSVNQLRKKLKGVPIAYRLAS